jgi:serine/threonine-protein kinase
MKDPQQAATPRGTDAMTPEHWSRVEELYQRALEQAADERTSFVTTACGTDHELRLELLQLLAHADGDSADLRRPLIAVADQIRRLRRTTLEGQTVGDYAIDCWLGGGGMGDVYRARDLALCRNVALKFIPEAFTSDPTRVSRLRTEAQLLARLNHPHIAAIHGLEDSALGPFLVLELVDGETLDARIRRSPLTTHEAIRFGVQLASALEAAHEQGVIHGDLKPANIALTREEHLKVLDFGLAHGPAEAQLRPNDAPVGGTPAYMAPEVVNGRAADKRSDVWGFGCILFEMLTGQRAFRAKNLGDTFTAVLTEEPDWSALPSDTPVHIRRLSMRCLQKDRGLRLCDLGDARLELATRAEVLDIPGSTRESWRWATFAKPAAETLVIAAAAIGIALIVIEQPRHDVAPQQRFTIDVPASASPIDAPAVAPDGTPRLRRRLRNP